MTKAKQVNGLIIRQVGKMFCVFDWDYESEILRGYFKSYNQAFDYCLSNS